MILPPEKEIIAELEKLNKYRKLFNSIINQPDKNLEFSVAELKQYYDEIEDLNDSSSSSFTPYIVHSDPAPGEALKDIIDFDAFEAWRNK